jgi:hypothetical protein
MLLELRYKDMTRGDKLTKTDAIRKLLSNGTGNLLAWLFRVTLIGIFFWFKAEFVTKDKYLEDQGKEIEQWTTLTSTLTHINDVLGQLDKHDDDQEKRLRELEHGKR